MKYVFLLSLIGFSLSSKATDTDQYTTKTSWQCHPHPLFHTNWAQQWSAYINFGVVVYNPYYKIYRSTGLNKAGLETLKTHLLLGNLDCPQNIVYLNDNHYAGDESESTGWGRILADKVLDLLGFSMYIFSGNFASGEEEVSVSLAGRKGGGSCSQYADIKYFPFNFVHVRGVGENQIDKIDATANFLALKDELLSDWDNRFRVSSKEESERQKAIYYKVLKKILILDGATDIHCKGGIHRTGIVVLSLRYLQGGNWTKKFKTNKTPWWLMDVGGLHPVRANLSNLAEMEYYYHSSGDFRQHNLTMIESISQEPFFQCLQRKFSCYLNAVSPETPASVRDCYPFQAHPGQCSVNPHDFTPAYRDQLWNECVVELK